MDVTGISVRIDATAAKSGEQQFNASLDSMAARAKTVSQQVGDFKAGETGLRSLSATARTVSTQVAEAFGTIRFGFKGLIDSVLNFRVLFDSAIAGISLNMLVDKVSKVEDIKTALRTVSGSAGEAAASWRFLTSEADKFGLEADQLGIRFARLKESTAGTAMIVPETWPASEFHRT